MKINAREQLVYDQLRASGYYPDQIMRHGMPDFAHDDGNVLSFFEVKGRQEPINDAQKKMFSSLERHGHRVHICYGDGQMVPWQYHAKNVTRKTQIQRMNQGSMWFPIGCTMFQRVSMARPSGRDS